MLIERSEQTKYLSIPFRMTVPLKKCNFTALFVSYKTESYITQDLKKNIFYSELGRVCTWATKIYLGESKSLYKF